MVLLTSSQVSVAISSAIVISFTTALFLSGYAIQQRTVRNLRAAIRPDTSPQLFLPDRFRDATTELEDGTIVMLDEYNRPIRLKAGRVSIGKAEEDFKVADAASLLGGNSGNLGQQVEITIQETLSANSDQQQQQKVLALEEPATGHKVMPENGGDVSQDPQPQPDEPEPVPAQPQPAPWEIRSEDGVVEPEPDVAEDDGGKPLSKAERRRKIKEDIQKLAQGDTPLYYQRRLW